MTSRTCADDGGGRPGARIGVLVVDDHPVVLAGLRALLGSTADLRVVATARSATEALSVPPDAAPDVCIVDLRLPDGDGITLATRLRSRWPGSRVLILTLTSDPTDVVRSLGARLDGYILKDSEPSELLAAVRAVAHGSIVLGRGTSDTVTRAADSFPDPGPLARLDARDREILALLSEGLGVVAVAGRLYLAPKTVRNRIAEVIRKLGVRTRDEAVALAYPAGAVEGRPGSRE